MLGLDSETATARAEKAEEEVKELRQTLGKRDVELLDLNNKVQLLTEDLSRQVKVVEEIKQKQVVGEKENDTIELLNKKIAHLEQQVEEKERGRKSAVEEVRALELKAETAERKTRQLETEKAAVEKKLEDMTAQYEAVKLELAHTLKSLEDL
jgi:chromosome segregation ATPase